MGEMERVESKRTEGRATREGDQPSTFRWFPCVEELSGLQVGVVSH